MQGKKQPTGANSIRAFLLERCLEVQAQRCRWSDDARPLHFPASHAEPVGIPPEVNIACSTITQGVLPVGCETKKRYVAHVCNACMSVHGRKRPPAGGQSEPAECRWHSSMCYCVHCVGIAAYARNGPAGVSRCSKPTKCWELTSFHSCGRMRPSIRPCGGCMPPGP